MGHQNDRGSLRRPTCWGGWWFLWKHFLKDSTNQNSIINTPSCEHMHCSMYGYSTNTPRNFLWAIHKRRCCWNSQEGSCVSSITPSSPRGSIYTITISNTTKLRKILFQQIYQVNHCQSCQFDPVPGANFKLDVFAQPSELLPIATPLDIVSAVLWIMQSLPLHRMSPRINTSYYEGVCNCWRVDLSVCNVNIGVHWLRSATLPDLMWSV